MNVDFKRFLITELSRMPFYHVSPNGISHTVKCPYCDDDSPKHGHFGIKIDVESDEPILYHCFRCNAGGMVTKQTLDDLHIDMPNDLLSQLTHSNKVYAKKNVVTDISIMPFEIPTINNSLSPSLLQAKSDYIANRIGLKLQYAEGAAYRIVFSFKDFIDYNKIDYLIDIDVKYLKYIEENYVGFLSLNKNFIIFRSFTNKGFSKGKGSSYLRYIKYVLDDKCPDKNNFFTIPTTFDIMSADIVNVHISEGPFDILSVMANDIFITDSNNLFFAVCGFGYASVLKNIVKLGACPMNLFIYADNDKTDSEIIRQIMNKKSGLRHYIRSLTMVRNSYPGEKDFGVTKDRITPSSKVMRKEKW